MPYQREAEAVLADWRAVVRDMEVLRSSIAAGELLDGEYKALHAEAKRLREEYKRLVQEAIGRHRPVPPPVPTDDPGADTGTTRLPGAGRLVTARDPRTGRAPR